MDAHRHVCRLNRQKQCQETRCPPGLKIFNTGAKFPNFLLHNYVLVFSECFTTRTYVCWTQWTTEIFRNQVSAIHSMINMHLVLKKLYTLYLKQRLDICISITYKTLSILLELHLCTHQALPESEQTKPHIPP